MRDIAKNTIVIVFITFIFVIVCFVIYRGSRPQSLARYVGGKEDIYLDPGQKLQEVTWKDENLWILTRDMREEEFAESYVFAEKDVMGILEGTIHIYETDDKD